MTDEKDLNYISDIQEMMYGLGDCSKPLETTAKVIEEVVLEQLNSLINLAEEVSIRRSSKVISPQDILFVLRKDKFKLQRLINYLALKDQKAIFQNSGLSFSNSGDIDLNSTALQVSTQSNRSQICVAYLKELDIDISLDPSKQLFDSGKNKRQLRADWISKTLTPKQYTEFTKCRQTSFQGKFKKIQKFLDWLSKKHGESVVAKLKVSTYDILVYLAKETIAELMDLIFLLRQDRMASPNNPYSKAHITNASSITRRETYGSNTKIEYQGPITPEEVYEVIRRYWSNQLCPFGLFSRTFSRPMSCRIMV